MSDTRIDMSKRTSQRTGVTQQHHGTALCHIVGGRSFDPFKVHRDLPSHPFTSRLLAEQVGLAMWDIHRLIQHLFDAGLLEFTGLQSGFSRLYQRVHLAQSRPPSRDLPKPQIRDRAVPMLWPPYKPLLVFRVTGRHLGLSQLANRLPIGTFRVADFAQALGSTTVQAGYRLRRLRAARLVQVHGPDLDTANPVALLYQATATGTTPLRASANLAALAASLPAADFSTADFARATGRSWHTSRHSLMRLHRAGLVSIAPAANGAQYRPIVWLRGERRQEKRPE